MAVGPIREHGDSLIHPGGRQPSTCDLLLESHRPHLERGQRLKPFHFVTSHQVRVAKVSHRQRLGTARWHPIRNVRLIACHAHDQHNRPPPFRQERRADATVHATPSRPQRCCPTRGRPHDRRSVASARSSPPSERRPSSARPPPRAGARLDRLGTSSCQSLVHVARSCRPDTFPPFLDSHRRGEATDSDERKR